MHKVTIRGLLLTASQIKVHVYYNMHFYFPPLSNAASAETDASTIS